MTSHLVVPEMACNVGVSPKSKSLFIFLEAVYSYIFSKLVFNCLHASCPIEADIYSFFMYIITEISLTRQDTKLISAKDNGSWSQLPLSYQVQEIYVIRGKYFALLFP